MEEYDGLKTLFNQLLGTGEGGDSETDTDIGKERFDGW